MPFHLSSSHLLFSISFLITSLAEAVSSLPNIHSPLLSGHNGTAINIYQSPLRSGVGFEEVSIKERKYAILYSSFHSGVWKVGVMVRALAIILNQGRGNTRTQAKVELGAGRSVRP